MTDQTTVELSSRVGVSPEDVQKFQDDLDEASRFVTRKTAKQLVHSLNFATGLAWKATVLIGVFGTNKIDPKLADDDVWGFWFYAVVVLLFTIPVATKLQVKRDQIEQQIKEAREAKDDRKVAELIGLDNSIKSIVNWGLTYLVATAIDLAINASIPDEPGAWTILHVFSVLLAITSLVYLFAKRPGIATFYLKEKDPKKLASHRTRLVNTLIGGSSYVVALTWLAVPIEVFSLNNPTQDENIGFVWLFNILTILTCTALLRIVAVWRERVGDRVTEKRAEMEAQELSTEQVEARIAEDTNRIQLQMAKLCFQSLNTVMVITTYASIKVSLMSALRDVTNFHSNLPVGAAILYLVITIIVAVIFGIIVDKLCARVKATVMMVDREFIPGKADDLVLEAIIAVDMTLQSSFSDALGWLTGLSLGGALQSIYKELVLDHMESNSKFELCITAAFYAVVVTMISVFVSIKMGKWTTQ